MRRLLSAISSKNLSPLVQQSLRNSCYSVADYLLLPILFIVATPIFLRRLGIEQYGIWMLVNTITGFGGVLGFGLTDATIKFVSQHRATHQMRSVVRVIRATLAMYSFLGSLCGVVLFVAAPVVVARVFHVRPEQQALGTTAIRIAGLGIAVRFIDSVFESALQGYDRYDLAARASMVVNTLTVLCNLYSVSRGQSLVTVLITIIIFQVGGATQKALFVVRLTNSPRVVVPKVSPTELRETLGYALYSWVQSISTILLIQVDRFLIASYLGVQALAYYAVCLQLSQHVHTVVAKGLSFLFPLASGEKAKGNQTGLLRYYGRGMLVATVVGTGGGVVLFLNATNILTLWMGREFAFATAPTLRVLALSFAVMATSVVPYYYLNGAGHVRLNTVFGLLSGISVSLAAVTLIPSFGIAGAAWSRLCNLPSGILARTVLHARILEDRRWYVGFLEIIPVLTTFGIAYIFLVSTGEPIVPLPTLVVRLAGCFIAATLLAGWQCLIISPSGVTRQLEASPSLK